MSDPVDTSTTFVGSHEKPMNGPGQNGYQGASSAPMGKGPKAGAQVGLSKPDVSIAPTASQTRDISAEQIAAHPAMIARPHNSGSPSGNAGPVTRPSSVKATPGNHAR
jgi:hypothetical protein